MRSEMPTLGRSPRGPALRRAVALVVVVACVAAIFFWRRARHHAAPKPQPLVQAQAQAQPQTPPPSQAPQAQPPARPVAPPAPAAAERLKRAGLRKVSVTIDGPLETALVAQVGRDEGLPLAQIVVRALVWWVAVPNDLRRGDTIDLLIDDQKSDEPVIEAIRFSSQKLAKTFRAYRFKPPADTWSRLYQPDGEELEKRLTDAPLDDYEQVTSLLRDGRGHKGVDFKVPVGTPVKATFDATVARKNWNWRGNGNSLDLAESGGEHRHAIYLHLSEVAAELHVGDRVTRGQLIAKSGNTGHSFAPHLHYQLMSASGQVLDPLEAQPTFRRTLSAEQRPAFDAEVKRLDGLLDLEVAGK